MLAGSSPAARTSGLVMSANSASVSASRSTDCAMTGWTATANELASATSVARPVLKGRGRACAMPTILIPFATIRHPLAMTM